MWPGPRPTFVPSGILIHPGVWPQQTWAENRGLRPLRDGAGSASNTNVVLAEAYHRTKWHLDTFNRLATTDMGRKLGAVPSFLGRLAGFPSSTMWPGPRPTFIPSGILIHLAVWPQ